MLALAARCGVLLRGSQLKLQLLGVPPSHLPPSPRRTKALLLSRLAVSHHRRVRDVGPSVAGQTVYLRKRAIVRDMPEEKFLSCSQMYSTKVLDFRLPILMDGQQGSPS